MDTTQIANILHKNRHTKNCFKGVTPSDQIRKYNDYPYALVANTDKSNERGTHWVAMFVPKPNFIEYFDSFGQKPNEEISKFLTQFDHITINNKKVQSIFDTSCGAHVIYFIIQRCKGLSFKSIIKDLNYPYADSLVKFFVYKLLSI